MADYAEEHVSIATSMSENNLELQKSLASPKVEEEEDWVWEGLSQWSIDPTIQGGVSLDLIPLTPLST